MQGAHIDRKKFMKLLESEGAHRARAPRGARAHDPPYGPVARRVMRVEFHRPDAPDTVVATAVWDGGVRQWSSPRTTRSARR